MRVKIKSQHEHCVDALHTKLKVKSIKKILVQIHIIIFNKKIGT